MADWRDVKSGLWVTILGTTDPEGWLQLELRLAPGEYRREPTADRLKFGDAKPSVQNWTVNDTGRTYKVVVDEVSSNVYFAGYWRDPL